MLPELSLDAVESMLVTFDTLVHLGDQGQRQEEAGFLREADTCEAVCQESGILVLQ